MKFVLPTVSGWSPLILIGLLCGCGSVSNPVATTSLAPSVPVTPSTPTPSVAVTSAAPKSEVQRVPVEPNRTVDVASVAVPPSSPVALVAPAPIRFEDAVERAGLALFAQAQVQLGGERRTLVIDLLIDANTGAQTVSTAAMGTRLAGLAKTKYAGWTVKELTRNVLAEKPLLLIGTLTPVNVQRSIDTPVDAFRVWVTMIDLRSGRVVAKQLDRATVDSVNPEPLPFYRDSPTWQKDKTAMGYINSCQVNTKVGDPADPEYLARLPGAAVV